MSSVYFQIPELFHTKPEQKAPSTMHVTDLMLFPILSKSAHADFSKLECSHIDFIPPVDLDSFLRIKERLYREGFRNQNNPLEISSVFPSA